MQQSDLGTVYFKIEVWFRLIGIRIRPVSEIYPQYRRISLSYYLNDGMASLNVSLVKCPTLRIVVGHGPHTCQHVAQEGHIESMTSHSDSLPVTTLVVKMKLRNT